MELFFSDYFALFLIICLGFILGNIKIKGISLDVSAIIFVSLLFGHLGVELPDILGTIGLILFIYTIGMQAGPGFFDSFKTHGRKLVVLAVIVTISASILTLASIWFLNIDKNIAIGLLSGALTSTPGLAAAIVSTQSSLASIGYGIAYPFGVIGVILFVRLYPRLFKVNIAKEEEAYEANTQSHFDELYPRNFTVENEKVIGKSLAELRIRTITQAVISRISKDGEAFPPSPDTILQKGDLIRAVGSEEALRRIELLIGQSTEKEIPMGKNFELQSVLVTNKEVVNKSLGEFNLWGNYHATITRVRRSGIDITPNPQLRLLMGDKLMVACSRDNMKQVMSLFGNNDKKLSDTDFFPIAAGIVLGILLGQLSISFGDSFTFNLGLTGGILIISLLLGRIGKTGKVLWTMSASANQLLRQLGLMFFLASVGTNAGKTIVETFTTYGIMLFFIGVVLTIFPMIVAAIAARVFYKMNVLTMLGALTGAMTSTPGLAAVDPMTDTNAPSVAYATVYPIAMVFLIICIQVLCLF
ncbi:MAG: transporter [Bacteroidota bacterium]|nr:MAG: transporter [Bacteroidota bacterium]